MNSLLRCPSCRAFIQADDTFCWSCGSRLGLPIAPAASRTPAHLLPKELDPDIALALRRAHLAHQRGQLDEAEQMIRSLIAREPDGVPALSMLARILKEKGDIVGSVAAAQRVTEIAAEGRPLPGAVARAREDRARIEQQVVREVAGPLNELDTPLSIYTAPDRDWCRSRRFYVLLTVIGALSLFLALVAVLKGQLAGYLWFGGSLLTAGWCYHDAESRRLGGLFWGTFILCLGPFGLAIYILSTN